jgi:succinyl-diaminopimelate desuccinylase
LRKPEAMKTQSAEDLRNLLDRAVEAHFEEMLRDTTKLIQFQTVSGGNEEQEAAYREQIPLCFAWLEELATRMGFTFRNWDNKVAEIEWAHAPEPGEGRRPVFGIASHIDVVTPVGTWTHPPFSGARADGAIWGRGTQDDKGPLIQSLYGIYAAKQAGIRPAADVRIIIGTLEETGDWSDIELYVEKRGNPDVCFTPDANFPLINGEKGMCNIRFHASWPAVTPDPETGMEFVGMRGGERSNIVPSLAEVRLRYPAGAQNVVMGELMRELTTFQVENTGSNPTIDPHATGRLRDNPASFEPVVSFLGKAAHSSTPEKGHNAIVDAVKFFSDIEALPSTVRAFIQFLALTGWPSDGSNLALASDHEYIGETTINLAIVKIGATGGEAIVNVRPTLGLTCDEVFERCRAAAQAFTEATGLEIAMEADGASLDAIFLDPSQPEIGPFLDTLLTAYNSVTGRSSGMVAIGGSTYAKAFPNCCAFGPVDTACADEPELAHQADERFPTAAIRRNALIYGLSVALYGR